MLAEYSEAESFYGGSEARATQYVQFQLGLDEVRPGAVACLTSELILYDDSGTADRNLGRLADEFADLQWSELSAQGIDKAFHQTEVVAYGCSECCEAASGEAYLVLMQERNVLAIVESWAFEAGGDLDSVLDLAQKQRSRMRSVFARDDR